MLRNLLTLIICVLSLSAIQAQSIGIIGDATPLGWDEDTDMTQDPDNADVYTITLDLTTNECKFRQDDAWDVNWGGTTFPSGVAELNGPNIPVVGGNYDISINIVTGEYNFVSNDTPFNEIGIIGSATPMGWDEDTDMIQNADAPNEWSVEIELTAGDVKFRADNDWAVSWGGTDFPTGVATSDNGPDLPVMAGNYNVTFNTATGEYNFELLIPTYDAVDLIGSGTDGTDIELNQSSSDPSVWTGNVSLVDGEVSFRGDDDAAIVWGSTDFPTGTATLDGDAIPVTAGDYNVTFNTFTGEYSFDDPIAIFDVISVIGTATGFENFDNDVDMVQDADNPDQWTLELALVPGELKFRADNDWTVNWGGTGYPGGTATQDGPNINIPLANNFEISFNATTGQYVLAPGVSWGIIGEGGPTLSWDMDADMDLSGTIGGEWSGTFETVDGELKFRKNDDWAVNLGGDTFPDGVATQDGPNIPVTAGTWDVSINTITGEYLFSPSSSTTSVLSTKSISVFPNPTAGKLTIEVSAEELEGEVLIQIMDMTGRVISAQQTDVFGQVQIDVNDLNNGNYIMQMSNDDYVIGKKFTVLK